MVGRGLCKELDDYVNGLGAENRTLNFQEGQLQTIGVKEFLSYIQLADIERCSETGDKLFEEGLERLKIVTKQYAKRQVQWMKQRFLKSSRREVPPVYGLDGNETDELPWTTNITTPAIQILDAHLQDKLDLQVVSDKKLKTEDNPNEDLISRRCEVCDNVIRYCWEVFTGKFI